MQQFRPKSATSKWAPILESNLGRKLKSRAEAAVDSTLLETPWVLLCEKSDVDSGEGGGIDEFGG